MTAAEKALDACVSYLIKDAAAWTCERCGLEDPGQMQAAHYFVRRWRSTRWQPMNLFCLCDTCHRFTENVRDLFEEFYIRTRGEGQLQLLVEKKREIARYRDHELRQMLQHYGEQQRLVTTRRRDGEQGPINVVPWD